MNGGALDRGHCDESGPHGICTGLTVWMLSGPLPMTHTQGSMINNELRILQAYAIGELSRSRAMKSLGLDWYGDPLVRMTAAGLRVTEPSSADKQRMRESVARIFGTES